MRLAFFDLMKLLVPLSKEKKVQIGSLAQFLHKNNLEQAIKLVRIGKIQVTFRNFGTSHEFLSFSSYPEMNLLVEDKEIGEFVKHSNEEMAEKAKIEAFKKFSFQASTRIPGMIAQNIQGMESIKMACAIQLFSNERTHILLLGDPGTGKTDIIRSTSELHPISSFGLGSGTSGAGLGVTYKGDEMIKGLLPLADKGLCCIDELNLMKQEDRASLYNAMEKGFITYDKGKKHVKIDADVCILATANPKGDKFAGWIVETLKKQMPFDSALLTRFHLIFLLRKPDMKEFLNITRHIIKGEKKKEHEANRLFIREYVRHAREIEVTLPKNFEEEIVKFIEGLKSNESKYLIEISPRLVVGFIRLVKASARMDLRKYVTGVDIDRIKEIFTSSLELKKKKE